MEIRPYQDEAIEGTFKAWEEFDRVLGVMGTGGGKTCIAAEIARRRASVGPTLFLADAQQLVYQTADKFQQMVGLWSAIEMADSRAQIGDKVVVATTQSIALRLDKWPKDYFKTLIIDEAHRNTLGEQAQKVLTYFTGMKVLGMTATPKRCDKKQLGSYYETIAFEIGLVRLITEKWLSRITIKSIPLDIDTSKLRVVAGDYRDSDVAEAISPHLLRCAELLKSEAPGRKTVAFLPLIDVSKAFCAACNSVGLRAVHVDGNDREGMKADYDVICNASLLTTGWDEPSIDCVLPLKLTRSLPMLSQMIGRGTRLFPGKSDVLVLDPLYLASKKNVKGLLRPASLIARTEEEADDLQEVLDSGRQTDLLRAESNAKELRKNKLLDMIRAAARYKRREIDAVEFAMSLGDSDLADYEPEMAWESKKPSAKQIATLAKFGFGADSIKDKGYASKLLDILIKRAHAHMATAKQVKWLMRFNHPSPWTATFADASAFLDEHFKGTKAS